MYFHLIHIWIFFRKSLFFIFYFYKIADFEISKKKLRVRLKSFLLICDACIASLSPECESSFKSLFWFSLQKHIWFFLQINFFFFFYPLQKQIWFLPIKSFFLLSTKTDLIFYPLQKQIWFFFKKRTLFIRQIYLN